jgi:NAD(P)-dependent dehydrogenase (short-subunit alcohol dehydrogenase family)
VPTVLITGASTGIGRATALRLAGSGWTVLAGVRKAADGEALKAAAGERVMPVELDVTDHAQIERAAQRVAELTGAPQRGATGAGPSSPGRLDALVNNAGIGFGGPLELISEESLRAQFDVNVFGQVAVTRALLGALRAARGRIVIVSSVGGRVALPFSAPYGASKHALEAIGDALRGELHSSHIDVSLIEPGSVQTPIWGKSREQAGQVSIPPELQREYGHMPAAFEKTLHQTEQRGVAPELVAETIEKALTARRPRTRYLVGRDARAMVLGKALLPDRLFDLIVRRAMGV